ncbi:hypothetical protein NUACC26_085480 [Scytonema sp. NUACC26]
MQIINQYMIEAFYIPELEQESNYCQDFRATPIETLYN